MLILVFIVIIINRQRLHNTLVSSAIPITDETAAEGRPAGQKSYSLLSEQLFGTDFKPANDVETYNAGNLYEKIDGKADLYLQNEFVSLSCRRYSSKSAEQNWAEVYIYDMTNGENAFAVYSLQKRSETTPLDWAQFGYSASDSVYVAAGKYYIEIFLSSEDNSLLASAQSAAGKIAASVSDNRTKIAILTLFPVENLVNDSFKFIKADAFGCSELESIFTAEYKINGISITAYLSKKKDSQTAGQTVAKYYRFLTDNGAKDLQHNMKLPDLKAVELFGTNELFFSAIDYFAGARGSAPIGNLEQIAAKLMENLPHTHNVTEQ
jgi:hypothetical protein